MTGSLFLRAAQEVFSWAKSSAPANCGLELFMTQGRGRSIVWSEKQCEDINQAEGGGAGIRVILHHDSVGRQGFAFTTSFSKENIRKTTQRALESAQIVPGDAFRKLPLPLEPAAKTEKSLPQALADPEIFSENLLDILERLKENEAKLLKKSPLLKSILRAGFSEGASEVAILNSNGIEENFYSTHCGLGVSCLAEKGGERQEGGYGLSKIFRKDLDWDFIFEKASEKTLALLGGKPIPSGKVPVLFDPAVGCDFLSLISGAACADSVQKGKSFFQGQMGKEVASKEVSIVDDGTLEKGLSTSPVDDEGVPTQKTSVIDQGRLNQYLYDTYAALKDHTVSTGNAGRAGFKSSPSSGASNFYLCAGSTPRRKLLGQTTGLYLYDVMGLHMADPISGDFSVGVIGAWVENGEFKDGVRGVTLAGNLLGLLKNIDAVCDDLTFFGSVGSPTFRVNELTVSGQ